MGKEVGANPALVNQAATHLGPSGFDPGEGFALGRYLTVSEAEAQGYTVLHVREHGGVQSMLTTDGSYTVVYGAPSYMHSVHRANKAAQGMEARRAATLGAVHDSPVAKPCAPNQSPPSDKEQ